MREELIRLPILSLITEVEQRVGPILQTQLGVAKPSQLMMKLRTQQMYMLVVAHLERLIQAKVLMAQEI